MTTNPRNTGGGRYAGLDWDKVFDMYYANTGNYDWRTKKGEVKAWKHTLKQIRSKFGLHSDSNILDRIRRHGYGSRSAVAPMTGRSAGHGPKRIPLPFAGEPSPDEPGGEPTTAADGGGEPETRSTYMRKVAANGHILHATLTSPRGVFAIHGIAKEIAKAMGVNCPSPQELAGMLAKMAK